MEKTCEAYEVAVGASGCLGLPAAGAVAALGSQLAAQNKRKEKARIAARARRSQEASIILEMANELHITQEKIRRIDKATIVKLAIDYIKAFEILCRFRNTTAANTTTTATATATTTTLAQAPTQAQAPAPAPAPAPQSSATVAASSTAITRNPPNCLVARQQQQVDARTVQPLSVVPNAGASFGVRCKGGVCRSAHFYAGNENQQNPAHGSIFAQPLDHRQTLKPNPRQSQRRRPMNQQQQQQQQEQQQQQQQKQPHHQRAEPIAIPAKALIQAAHSMPRLSTKSIFAPKTKDMNSHFLMISDQRDGNSAFVLKPDEEVLEEDDLTHLAPQAGDSSISLEVEPLDGIVIDTGLFASCSPPTKKAPILHAKQLIDNCCLGTVD